MVGVTRCPTEVTLFVAFTCLQLQALTRSCQRIGYGGALHRVRRGRPRFSEACNAFGSCMGIPALDFLASLFILDTDQ